MILTTDETRDLWREAEARNSFPNGSRIYGFPNSSDLSGKTGAQIIDAMIAGTIPVAHQSHSLGYFIAERHDDKIVMQGCPSITDLNPMGMVSGGWISTLMDCAMGSAVLNELPEGKSYVTKELKVEFHHGLDHLRVPYVRVDAEVDFATRLSYAKAVMYGPDQNIIYATATCTCRVFSVPTI